MKKCKEVYRTNQRQWTFKKVYYGIIEKFISIFYELGTYVYRYGTELYGTVV